MALLRLADFAVAPSSGDGLVLGFGAIADRDIDDGLARLAGVLGLPTIASARPMMHVAARRRMADVLTAIRTGTRVDALGRAALANAEQRLRGEAEMLRLFQGHADAVHRSGEIAGSAAGAARAGPWSDTLRPPNCRRAEKPRHGMQYFSCLLFDMHYSANVR